MCVRARVCHAVWGVWIQFSMIDGGGGGGVFFVFVFFEEERRWARGCWTRGGENWRR